MTEQGEGSRASVTVEIAGDDYTLRTNANEAYTRQCAAVVSRQMAEIRKATGLDRQKAAILVALSLADEVLQQQNDAQSLGGRLAERARTAADRLNAVLDG